MTEGVVTATVVRPELVGTDLLATLRHSAVIDVSYTAGLVASAGLARAREAWLEASDGGVDWLLQRDPLPDVVFEATSAGAHMANPPCYAGAGIRAVDLTPARRADGVSAGQRCGASRLPRTSR